MQKEHAETILIVEDDAELRDMLQDVLKKPGRRILTAPDGLAGLDVTRAHHVDVVLSDLVMPRLNGMQLLEILRRDGFRLPFIVLTANGTKESALEMLKLSAFDFIEKPVRTADLIAVIEKAVSISTAIQKLKEELKTRLADESGHVDEAKLDAMIFQLARMKALRS